MKKNKKLNDEQYLKIERVPVRLIRAARAHASLRGQNLRELVIAMLEERFNGTMPTDRVR